MSKVVLDSSVLIAVLNNEYVDRSLAPVIKGAILSTVNLAEVHSHLQEHQPQWAATLPDILGLLEPAHPFTDAQAELAGMLRPRTKSLGLSLGDRACLALAIELNADVYTTDRAWRRIDLPCRIHLIR